MKPPENPDLSASKQKPDLHLENSITGIVAGIDEVGRGPIAGSVVAAAVIITPDFDWSGIDDSKRLSHERREEWFHNITSKCHYGIGIVEREGIDQHNILQATFIAMRLAVDNLAIKPDFALVDGNRAPDLGIPARAVVKGDSISASIAAASIIAKVTRDRIMEKLHVDYPHYNWRQNKGYPTAEHLEAIKTYGITPHHRLSFRPVREAAMVLSCSGEVITKN